MCVKKEAVTVDTGGRQRPDSDGKKIESSRPALSLSRPHLRGRQRDIDI